MKYCLAIDIGASSGRHIVGWKEDGELRTKEVYRFKNGVSEVEGHLVWDIKHLVEEVKNGIEVARNSYELESLSIDTWGVDYVLLKGKKEVYPVYAYRDSRTEKVIDEVHSIVPFEKLLGEVPADKYDYFRCAFRSLALSYKKAIEELEHNTGHTYEELYIVGGGAKNRFLNRLTEEATGKKVIALPIEATALGNLNIQVNA